MYSLKSNRFQSGPFAASPAFASSSQGPPGAEDDPDRGAGQCPICGSFLSGAYYRVDGYAACAVCAIQARARLTRKVASISTPVLAAAVALACVTLPFLGRQKPLQGAIGIFVLFVGMRMAWQLSAGRRLNLDGPHKVSLQK